MKLWQIDIYPASGQPDRLGNQIALDARDSQLFDELQVSGVRGYLIQAEIELAAVQKIADELLTDSVVETCHVAAVGDNALNMPPNGKPRLVNVLPKPGVTDPVAESAIGAIRELGIEVDAVTTFRKYWVSELSDDHLQLLSRKFLANESIEQVVVGNLDVEQLNIGNDYQFELRHVPLLEADADQLSQISRDWQLSLSPIEMRTIQDHFAGLKRNPTDVELETIAQTWSEHCSHKTLAGRVNYRDEKGERYFDNMLKETIFAATVSIRELLGEDDWCVSVFKDNAGIVRFDDLYNLAFKVETHNRPSALEPYGGANTGIGGVIRDTLGTGLGAKPVCSTDVFCVAAPDTPQDALPAGVLHPRRVLKGVVAGVRDYGNRMGIPTVNGAVYFDDRYLGNPLVFCGNVGFLPNDKSFKQPEPNDLIVAIGGRTGRDGIHGATFSSAELTDKSEQTSGGAVQIGNAITEKMLADVLLQARDQNLFNAVTDCGAGGFSSAVGEMGEEIGAEVWLDKAPLKYDGLSYTEIWISEAQERMVFAVPPENWQAFETLCQRESVEATVIGRFEPTERLVLKYGDETVCELSMKFMHDGRPPVLREAVFHPPATQPMDLPSRNNYSEDLLKILAAPNVASKEWIIRQYDHEVQAGSVIKPLVGVDNDGPGDAAVVRPRLDSNRGVVISCGMNPHYGDLDPYHMATSAIDEAIRNSVAVGADPDRIAILDNFCWGYTDRPETLGALVRAALGCHDLAIAMKTPFISGKDSLNNEFTYQSESGDSTTISIPSTLLISAMGQVDDVCQCVTMDFKASGNRVFQVGSTGFHLGGSHFGLVNDLTGGQVPQVDPDNANRVFKGIHAAIKKGLLRACHDLSEGGLAVALAEMCFAGGLGAKIELNDLTVDADGSDAVVAKLFSESNTRFVCEVRQEDVDAFVETVGKELVHEIGVVSDSNELVIGHDGDVVIESEVSRLKAAWQDAIQLD